MENWTLLDLTSSSLYFCSTTALLYYIRAFTYRKVYAILQVLFAGKKIEGLR